MKHKRYMALVLAMLMLVCVLTTGCGRRPPVDGTKPTAPTEKGGDGPVRVTPDKKPGREMKPDEVAIYLRTRVVKVESSDGIGSGFFIDDEGTIVTNYHVIDGTDSIRVVMDDGASYEVDRIVDFSPFHDVAVLKTAIRGNDYLEISEDYRQGSAAYAMGSPKNLNSTFTDGTISSTSRKIGLVDCIQIDVPINTGNSGGPVVNSKGEVIGINSFIRKDAQNIGFAIKMTVLDELDMDRNFTLNDYCEWFDKETGRSYYTPNSDGKGFRYTYINTYTTVTGLECLYSTDDLKTGRDGYSVAYLYYGYEYDSENYDKYCTYLKSIGFEYVGTDRDLGMDVVTYVHSMEGYTVDLYIDTVDNEILVSCPY